MNHLEAFLNAMKADAALVHRPENLRWLAGYTGEGCLYISAKRRVILTDFRYVEQVHIQCPDWALVQVNAEITYPALAAKLARAEGAKRVLVETDHLTYDDYQGFARALEGITLLSMGGIPEKLRQVKDAAELDCIRRAAAIASDAFVNLLPRIHAGMTERQIGRMLEYEMLELGSEGVAFETIAASGPNGALPHARPSDRVVEDGELLTLDFGATVNGYRSDMTRTVGFGRISDELRDIYETVRAAQQLGLDALAVGKPCKEIDRVVRETIDARYPGAFGHGLGHGVGLFIHEQPRLSATSTDVLVAGNVVTVEPGVYIPGLGGCRIEDTVIMTEDGFINTIAAPKELIEL
ncbi:MAG: aminopeptidase P family protein [Clostridia bacterium]|nr:aminopeptidase P family protein [Clostridia bacterium]